MMSDQCAICGLFVMEKAWYLEPKTGDFISVCRLCYRDLIMLRRWRRQDKEKEERYEKVKYDGKNSILPKDVIDNGKRN